jgi:drug/metabolite transporter (DMT)-like permease
MDTYAGATIVYFLITFSRKRLKSDVIVAIRGGKEIIFNLTFAILWGTVLSIVLLMWSITLCKVAVVQTIVSLVPIVVVPVSAILYKEKITLKTMIAAVISVCGVFILIWREDIALWMQTHWHL